MMAWMALRLAVALSAAVASRLDAAATASTHDGVSSVFVVDASGIGVSSVVPLALLCVSAMVSGCFR